MLPINGAFLFGPRMRSRMSANVISSFIGNKPVARSELNSSPLNCSNCSDTSSVINRLRSSTSRAFYRVNLLLLREMWTDSRFSSSGSSTITVRLPLCVKLELLLLPLSPSKLCSGCNSRKTCSSLLVSSQVKYKLIPTSFGFNFFAFSTAAQYFFCFPRTVSQDSWSIRQEKSALSKIFEVSRSIKSSRIDWM